MNRTIWMLALMSVMTTAVKGQVRTDPTPFIPRTSVAVGYSLLNANAPPGNSEGFHAQGGFASVAVRTKDWLSVAGEVNGVRATKISTYGQNLTLLTYTAGPRFSLHQRRMSEFAQAMFGAAQARDSYFPTATSYTTSANSFALTLGGGWDIELSHHFALRAFQAQYLHTALPNAVNGSQNQLLLGAGIVAKFGGHYGTARGMVSNATKKRLSITCSASVRNVLAGESLEVAAITRPSEGEDVEFVWTSNAGVLSRNTPVISVETTGLAPGQYHVTAHAELVQDNSVVATCEVPFRVVAPPPPPPAPVPAPTPAPPVEESVFHDHVKDVYFDYDKWAIKPEAANSLAEAAVYLKDHPQLRILLGGFSDERGSTSYNITLGLKRANAVRDVLVNAGVPEDRLAVVSYGKGVQVCTKPAESCYHRNRRTAFQIQP
ncbi:MAG: OmpA family protein [Acidobacteriaceae bacterium]|nr:OmpA family protein [Acidobacteriaceae bacterium]